MKFKCSGGCVVCNLRCVHKGIIDKGVYLFEIADKLIHTFISAFYGYRNFPCNRFLSDRCTDCYRFFAGVIRCYGITGNSDIPLFPDARHGIGICVKLTAVRHISQNCQPGSFPYCDFRLINGCAAYVHRNNGIILAGSKRSACELKGLKQHFRITCIGGIENKNVFTCRKHDIFGLGSFFFFIASAFPEHNVCCNIANLIILYCGLHIFNICITTQ